MVMTELRRKKESGILCIRGTVRGKRMDEVEAITTVVREDSASKRCNLQVHMWWSQGGESTYIRIIPKRKRKGSRLFLQIE